jgi:hypothetical protein
MEATCSSETPVEFRRTARHYIREGINLNKGNCLVDGESPNALLDIPVKSGVRATFLLELCKTLGLQPNGG